MNIVAHNLTAMNAQRQFGINTNNKAKSTEKLSSGYRINRASDDAAGLSISEKMRRQIRGLTKGVENTRDGVSLCQVADGALAEVNDMLHRITELSVKSANGTNTELDREYIQEEISQILQEIDRIGDTTSFNEEKIFVGEKEHITGKVPEVFTSNFTGTKAEFIQKFKESAIEGNDTSIVGEANCQVITAADISSSGVRSIHLSSGTYQIDSSVKDVQIVASGDVKIINSDIMDSHILCSDNTNLTLENVSITYGYNDGIDTGAIIFRNGNNSLTYYGTNKITAIYPQKAGIYLESTSAGSLNIRGNGDLTIDSGRSASVAIGARAGSPNSAITIESGNLNVNIGAYDHAPSVVYQTGIGDNQYFGLDTLTVNGGTLHVQTQGDGNKGINVTNLIVNGGTVITSGGDQATAANAYNSGEGIKCDNLSINGGAVLAIGGKDLSSNAMNAINTNNVSNMSSMTTDGYNYYLNVSDSYKKELEKGYDVWKDKDIWIHSGCEAGQGIHVEVDRMNTAVLGISDIDVSTINGAEHAMEAVKGALQKVTSNRSKIGAQQNRLEHTIANEENIIENTTSAESRIRDTDMAKEMVKYSNINILEQVGHAMMAQANQSNQGVLSLLQ